MNGNKAIHFINIIGFKTKNYSADSSFLASAASDFLVVFFAAVFFAGFSGASATALSTTS